MVRLVALSKIQLKMNVLKFYLEFLSDEFDIFFLMFYFMTAFLTFLQVAGIVAINRL